MLGTRSHELFTSDGLILMDPHGSLKLHMATGRDAAAFSEARRTRHGDPMSLDTQITSSCYFSVSTVSRFVTVCRCSEVYPLLHRSTSIPQFNRF